MWCHEGPEAQEHRYGYRCYGYGYGYGYRHERTMFNGHDPDPLVQRTQLDFWWFLLLH